MREDDLGGFGVMDDCVRNPVEMDREVGTEEVVYGFFTRWWPTRLRLDLEGRRLILWLFEQALEGITLLDEEFSLVEGR